MRTHHQNGNIALPESLSELKLMRKQDGVLALSDEFRTYAGMILESPRLRAISGSFDYESHGYGQLAYGPAMHERGPFALYKNGRLGPVRQGSYPLGQKTMIVRDLEDDLKQFETVWRGMFLSLAEEVAPLFGKEFEIRLKILKFMDEHFHYDKHCVAILPLGNDRKATILKAADGKIIRPENGSFIVTTPSLKHSSPVSDKNRACLGVTVYNDWVP